MGRTVPIFYFMSNLLRESDYLPTVQAALGLADSLRQSQPEVQSLVDALEKVVTRSHAQLEIIARQPENAARVNERNRSDDQDNGQNLLAEEASQAIKNLNAAYQALLGLKYYTNRSYRGIGEHAL